MTLDSIPWGYLYWATIAFVWGWALGSVLARWKFCKELNKLSRDYRGGIRRLLRSLHQMERAYRASLRRAMRVRVDADTFMIDHTQAVTRIAVGNNYKLVIMARSETTIDVQVTDSNGTVPVNEHRVSNTIN